MFWEDDFVHEMKRVHQEMESMFNNFLKVERSALLDSKNWHKDSKDKKDMIKYRTPKAHLCETETSLLVSFELPGIKKEDIDLKIKDNHLSVEVKKTKKKESEGKDEKFSVEQSQHFYRTMPLPMRVDAKKSKASYHNGMLRIELPKIGAKIEHIDID